MNLGGPNRHPCQGPWSGCLSLVPRLVCKRVHQYCSDLSTGEVSFSLDCGMHLDRPNEHILHHQRGCGGLANILDMIHRAKRFCLLICYLYLAQLNLFGKKIKIKDANTGSAVGSEYLLIKKVRKTPLIILIDSCGHIYALVFVQLHHVPRVERFWQRRSVRV